MGKDTRYNKKSDFFVIFVGFVCFLFCSAFRILSIAPFMSTKWWQRYLQKDLKEQYKLFNLYFRVAIGQVGQGQPELILLHWESHQEDSSPAQTTCKLCPLPCPQNCGGEGTLSLGGSKTEANILQDTWVSTANSRRTCLEFSVIRSSPAFSMWE